MEKKESFKCTACNKCFAYKSLLKRHFENIHEENKIVCHLCGATCKNKPMLKYHVAKIHNKNKGSTKNDFRILAPFF